MDKIIITTNHTNKTTISTYIHTYVSSYIPVKIIMGERKKGQKRCAANEKKKILEIDKENTV